MKKSNIMHVLKDSIIKENNSLQRHGSAANEANSVLFTRQQFDRIVNLYDVKRLEACLVHEALRDVFHSVTSGEVTRVEGQKMLDEIVAGK